LVVAPDSGHVHCLDADAESYWTHDTRAQVWGSPLIVDAKLYVGDGDGGVSVLALAKEKQLLAKRVMESWIASSPIFANGVLYVAGGDTLYAIGEKAGDWTQWRGPDRSNRSSETGLLTSWPTNGPPLLWKVTGLGDGIASVSVASGSIYPRAIAKAASLFIAERNEWRKFGRRESGDNQRNHSCIGWPKEPTGRRPPVHPQRVAAICRQPPTTGICGKGLRTSQSRGRYGDSDRPLVDGDS
jgi:hypothetical protein